MRRAAGRADTGLYCGCSVGSYVCGAPLQVRCDTGAANRQFVTNGTLRRLIGCDCAHHRVSQGHSHVRNPWAGSFKTIQVAIQAGFEPKQIVASDVSLFSWVIGLSASGRDLAELDVKFSDGLEHLEVYRNGPFFGGAILWGMSWRYLNRKAGPFFDQLKAELEASRDEYVRTTQARVNALGGSIRGVRFGQLADADFDGDSKLVYLAPRKDRDDQSGPIISWSMPARAEPTESNVGKALVLTYTRAKADRRVDEENRRRAVFVNETTRGTERILTNRPEELAFRGALNRKMVDLRPSAHPLLPHDYKITPNSKIAFVRTSKNVAYYYRDMFAHKLGVTRAEVYFLGLVDGHVWAACGFFLSDCTRRRYVGGHDALAVHEQFGFCVPCGYKRIVKLMLMCLSCRDFWQYLVECVPMLTLIGGPVEFKTTCLADVPELKTHRTVSKLRSRERMPNGKYKLVYVAPFRVETYRDCLKRWLEKDGQVLTDRAWSQSSVMA